MSKVGESHSSPLEEMLSQSYNLIETNAMTHSTSHADNM